MNLILEARGLTKQYQQGALSTVALREASLSVNGGEFVSLTGPSGSGKSTLLNILGLTDSPTSGELIFRGNKINFQNERALTEYRRSAIGYVFQSFNLLSGLTAIENIMVVALMNGFSFKEATGKSLAKLHAVGISDKAHAYPSELSGGQMQRVALCRALIHDPILLLADEPTGNLDSESGDVVLNLLKAEAKKGVAVIMATHSPHAMSATDRTLTLVDGALQTERPLSSIPL